MRSRKHPLLIYFSIVFIIITPIILIFIFLMPPYLSIKSFDTFKESILQKYSYINDIDYSHYSKDSLTITIKTPQDDLNWSEMKEFFLDTEAFLLNDDVESDLEYFYNNNPFLISRRPSSYTFFVEIKIDSIKNKTHQAKIIRRINGEWRYTDYNGNTFEILEKGELGKSPQKR